MDKFLFFWEGFQSYVWPVIAAILVFSFLVLIHEFGHFWMARRNGVKVLEFGIGFPPRLWGRQKGETFYSINAIPFGGFVRLFGEDVSDPKTLKDPRSFASKSKWARIQITAAGVIMNLLFALIALTIGFSIGIEPLIAEYDDVLTGIRKGNIEVRSGFILADIQSDSQAYRAGLRGGDQIISLNDLPLENFLVSDGKSQIASIAYKRAGINSVIQLKDKITFAELQLPMKPLFQMPRLYFFENTGSFKKGDKIEQVNGVEVFHYQDLIEANKLKNVDLIFVRRDEKGINLEFDIDLKEDDPVASQSAMLTAEKYGFVVESIAFDSEAKRFGVRQGDQIKAINGKAVNNIREMRLITDLLKGEEVNLSLLRDGSEVFVKLPVKEDGTLGLYLVPIINVEGNLKLYNGYENVSIVKINEEKYALPEAFLHSITEIWRLGVLTVKMFGTVLGNIFSSFSVPDGVAGPVGIAKLTVGFVKEGALSLLRFVAIISLSLAVLNILPIPALDGGRILFIAIEAVRGKPIKPKTEAMVHGFGFLILMLLIVLVTFRDIFG